MQKQNKVLSAFTLVELIVVITILAILATIAFISLSGYSQDARDSTRLSDVKTIGKTLEVYKLRDGQYPLPENGTQITFSGAEVWTQGIFGEQTRKELSKHATISNPPLDPLTNNHYTYSVLNTIMEYQLGGILEGGAISYNPSTHSIISQTQAAETPAAYIIGDYNGLVAKVSTGTTTYVLAVPSIISSDIGEHTLLGILANQKLVFKNYSNIPSSYAGYTSTGGFVYEPSELVVYEGSIQELSDDGTLLQEFATKLQQAYSGTTLQTIGIYKNLLTNEELVVLAGNIVNNELGGSVNISSTPINGTCGTSNGIATTTAPTINLCSAGTATTVTINTANYTWSCTGQNTGTTASCSAPRQYTVTFNANGGTTPSPETKAVTYNTAIGTLATTSRDGYAFNGWFTATSGGTQITENTEIIANITYYAQWTASFPSSCNNTQDITYSQATANQSTIYLNIDSYIGCLILDYPGGAARIAGTTVSSKVLVVSYTDDSTKKWWGYYGTYKYASSTTDGYYNTNKINGDSTAAGYLCWNKYSETPGIWYLPAKNELNTIYINKSSLGTFANQYYWSSTEAFDLYAWRQYFSGGMQIDYHKANSYYVRCSSRF
ncbi:MAG: InlB B-repeat-containing protein [Candidatus Gracilibacteria bacterium]|nr:InlB B-repeat-containing protein [Candidatus Gracilibacteria bacterium]